MALLYISFVIYKLFKHWYFLSHSYTIFVYGFVIFSIKVKKELLSDIFKHGFLKKK